MTQRPSVGVPVCYRHPQRETYVRCTRCDRPICPDCMHEASVGHQCPECVAEGRRTQRPARTAFGGSAIGAQGYMTIALIVTNVAVMVLAAITSGSAAALVGAGMGGLLGAPTPLHEWGALIGAFNVGPEGQPIVVPGGVSDGEYYRLLTSMFLHYGLIHLLINMYALWILGRPLEAVLGPWRFFALYLAAGLGGSVAVYWFSPTALTAGASGAIFGLFGALILVLRRLGRSASSVVPILVINLIITFGVPGISIAGHLGGLVTGAIVGAGLAYAPPKIRTPVQAAAIAGTLAVLGLATLARTATFLS